MVEKKNNLSKVMVQEVTPCLSFCMLVTLHVFSLSSADYLQIKKLNLFFFLEKKTPPPMTNSLDPDHAGRFIGHDLDPSLTADTNRQRVFQSNARSFTLKSDMYAL